MLLFDVNGQSLKRTDHFNPATDSVEYLKAKFTFKDSAWSGKTKTALFRMGTDVYKSVLSADGTCKVPAEVLVGGDSRVARIHGETIFVSLIGEYGTVRITTNEIAVKLNRSGYGDAEIPANPTESEYQQMTAVAADAVAEAENARIECENARADLVGVKNLFANAIKGNLSGAVVAADDVSPMEHNPVVRVHGKNLFDVSKLSNITGKLTNNNDGTLTVAANQYAVPTGKKINELCPSLKAGDVCTLSFSSTSVNTKYIWLNGANVMLYNSTYTFTVEMLNSELYLYGFRDTDGGYGSACTISNIQIEKGAVATDYEPYIDPSTATVTRCGKNLLNIRTENEQTVSGVEFVFDKDGRCTVSGTNTETDLIHVYATTTTSGIKIKKGTTVTISGLPDNPKCCLRVFTNTTTGNTVGGLQGDYYATQTITVTEDTIIQNVLVRVAGGATVNVVFEPMLEIGDTATAFERFAEPTTHIPAADGTVSGMTSLSPNMTILADADGAIVECEYIRDTNKVIDRLINAITALGGTV